jgi:hypothetical protein
MRRFWNRSIQHDRSTRFATCCPRPSMLVSLDGRMCSHLAVDGAHGGGDAQDGVHVADLHVAVDCGAVPLQLCSTTPKTCGAAKAHKLRLRTLSLNHAGDAVRTGGHRRQQPK